jgi:FAD:protein FMN transferase
MNRRDLIDPRHVAHVAGQVLAAFDDAPDTPDEVAVVRLGWRAMATGWQILLPYADAPLDAAREAFELLDELEDQLTVYRDHSEVSRLNRLAASQPVRLEPRLFDLLTLAQQITRDTDGAFDVAAGALIKAWGFFRGPKRVPPEGERREVMERVGMRLVELDPALQTARFLRDGVEINLGAIGKGYALDRMAEALAKIPAALLHGGSSSVYAKGDPHGGRRGWRVRLRHPWLPGRTVAEVWLRDRALGTSAATFQYLEHEGKKLGHVLDPRTGWPASGVASASVVAPSAAVADALSTAFYVGGIDLARRYCEARPEVGAVLLLEGEREPVVLNLSPGEYTLPQRPG